jgi:hypothetical protein
MEPRSTLHSTVVLRQDSALARERPTVILAQQLNDPQQQQRRFFPEPEIPIHPALEYEVYADFDESDDDEDEYDCSAAEGRGGGAAYDRDDDDPVLVRARRWKKRRRGIKLVLSSVVLIVSGVGTVVAAKIQAIPL